MFDSKARQRQSLKDGRMTLSPNQVQDFSTKICEQALGMVREQNFKIIHVYLPIDQNNEVDTWMLAKALLAGGSDVYTSVFGESRTLQHVKLQNNTIYDYDELGIPKPTTNFTQKASHYDVIYAPLLGFDKKLNRLGYGRGVYDTFMSDQKKALKIGLGYEIQKLLSVKTEKHDVQLDGVLTEKKLYIASR